ncbi:MAG: hypothetical protein HDQ87_02500 [Clostridia bacterium]|nr:hypothetical protein [Clostridia bacterium]
MNVNNIMDLGGSQSTSKARGTKSASKDQAKSADLFKSIIGQKRADSQPKSGLDVTAPASSQTASKPQQTQSSASRDTSSAKDQSAPVQGNESAPTDNLEGTVSEDAAVSEPEAAGEPVMEDEAAAAEEAPAVEKTEEPAEEQTEEPKQIFLIQSPIVAAATIAPVVISSETYQAAAVETIVNDVVLSDVPSEPQVLVQVNEAQLSVTPGQVEVETAQFTAVMDAQETPAAPAAPETAPVAEIAGDLQQVVVTEDQMPVQQQPTAESAVQPAQNAVETPEVTQVPAEEMQEAPKAPAPEAEISTDTQTEAPRTEAGDEFAAQVVREARDMVREQPAAEGAQEAQPDTALEADRAVTARTEADDTDDSAGKDSGQNKQTSPQTTTMPGTAPVAEDGRVDLRQAAAQPLEAEHYMQPETRQMIMSRVVDQVRSAVSPDRTEFYIQLKPDFLGGLSIGLVAEEKGIVAKIMTSSQQVHAALQADMSQLQQVLRDRGINVVEMDVSYNQMADTTSKDNSDNRQQQFSQGQSRSHGRISEQTEEALLTYDNTLTSHDVLTENGGSVEFTA